VRQHLYCDDDAKCAKDQNHCGRDHSDAETFGGPYDIALHRLSLCSPNESGHRRANFQCCEGHTDLWNKLETVSIRHFGSQ
jgi:hypothetical protein